MLIAPVAQDGVNLTIQCLMSYIVESLQKLSCFGIRVANDTKRVDPETLDGLTYHFHIMSIRGDWKFLKQILNLSRYATAEYICPFCMASKGLKDIPNNYTDLSDDAPWRSTHFTCSLPWDVEPQICRLQDWDIRKVGMDMLHIWNLGCARDLILGVGLQIFCFCRKLLVMINS